LLFWWVDEKQVQKMMGPVKSELLGGWLLMLLLLLLLLIGREVIRCDVGVRRWAGRSFISRRGFPWFPPPRLKC